MRPRPRGANHEDPAAVARQPGILQAEELAGWNLHRCELAVLSACETNVGLRRPGEGLQSLQAALHAAGVQRAVTTLWPVREPHASTLLDHFYEGLWKRGLPPEQALWQAKRALRGERAATRDWAAGCSRGASSRADGPSAQLRRRAGTSA